MNSPVLLEGNVMMSREVAAGQFLMALEIPASFPEPLPGQFVMLRATDFPLLARPFSIYSFKKVKNHGVVEIIFRISGKGTKILSTLPPRASLRIMGPLGNGFTIMPQAKRIVFVAGGMGLAPLTFLAEHYSNIIRRKKTARGRLHRQIVFYMGAKTADVLTGMERLEDCCDEVRASTDDGSLGYCGTVNELFRNDMAFYNRKDTIIYACGPAPMLKGMAEMLCGKDFFCQVSMEERMACGLGACLGCALPVLDTGRKISYKRVCKDGPVFNINEIAWT